MVYNGITFYEASWQGKTFEYFIKHEAHHGLSEAELKEAWALLRPDTVAKSTKPSKTETVAK